MKAIEVENIGKKYIVSHEKEAVVRHILPKFLRIRNYEEFWALKDINFSLEEGETLGVIGRNGVGKTTLLNLLAGITAPTEGRLEVNGKISAILSLGAGFHPELTGEENIYLNGSILGLRAQEIKRRFKEIVDFSELNGFISTPLQTYSSGMYMRLGFAIAINVNFDILLIDEILSVGDLAFQEKCLNKIKEFQRAGKTMVIASQSLDLIKTLCNRVILLERGRVKNEGKPSNVITHYKRIISGKAIEELERQDKVEEKEKITPIGVVKSVNQDEESTRKRKIVERKESGVVTAEDRPRFPSILNIEVTNDCNLSCPMCSRTHDPKVPDHVGYMSWDTFKGIIDESADEISTLLLIGRGEPLLHNKLSSFIHYVKSKGIPRTVISTNCILLTEDIGKELIKAGLDSIVFSLDAVSEKIYKKCRSKGGFHRINTNVHAFLKIRDKLQSKLPLIDAQLVLMRQNMSEALPFVRYWSQFLHKTDSIWIKQYCPADVPDYDISSDQREFIISRICDEFGSTNQICQIKIEDYRPPISFEPCALLWQQLIVTWNGYVLPCVYTKPIRGRPTLKVNKCSLRKIFNDEFYCSAWKSHRSEEISYLCIGCKERYMYNPTSLKKGNVTIMRNSNAERQGVYDSAKYCLAEIIR